LFSPYNQNYKKQAELTGTPYNRATVPQIPNFNPVFLNVLKMLIFHCKESSITGLTLTDNTKSQNSLFSA